jgi:hypothetical protein
MLSSKFIAIAILAGVLAYCGGPRAEEPSTKPDLLQPGREATPLPEEGMFYVLTAEQFIAVKALVHALTEAVEKQKAELEHLREQTKPVGSCS